ncbi:MAG: glycerol-3-phosphate acyltransferase [Phycicoccus sp.]|nr:glycerol-3-phosphate acyltransferase [Phycicoccus sp.]
MEGAGVAGLAILIFFVGATNPAAILARVLGKDLRSTGSGNPGATNAGRVLGVRWGVLVGVLDILKGWLPTWLVVRSLGLTPALVCGLAVVLGHMFSPFLKGRGGKGVATTFGVLLAVSPWLALGAWAVFTLAYLGLRTVGESSIVVCLALVIVGVVETVSGAGVPQASVERGIFLVLLGLLVLARHRHNVRRAIERRRRPSPT